MSLFPETAFQTDHDEAVAAIKAHGIKDPEHAVLCLVKMYRQLYQVRPYIINCGMCEEFANDLCELLGEGAEAVWGDSLLDETDDPAASEVYAYHCITVFEGRYYDAEAPWGVDNFRDIPSYVEQRMP